MAYFFRFSVQKANAKVHDGVCQRCNDILEWKVKYNKYKFLTQPRKWWDTRTFILQYGCEETYYEFIVKEYKDAVFVLWTW